MKKIVCFIIVAVMLAADCMCYASETTLPNSRLGKEILVSSAALENLNDTSMQIDVNAKAAVLMEADSGIVLMAQNENEKLYPASVTKIMSMILVCEAIEEGKINLDDTVSASENACSKGGSQIWLEPGEQMTVDELLKATAVYSANDACTLLGEYVAGGDEAFVEMMNKKADELGMKNTDFENCTGLDDTAENHMTTAYDIALMSRELLKYDIIKNYSTIWMDSLRGGKTQLVNTNKLVRTYKGITGLKTGTTDKAGCCVSATAERDGLSLIAVVMGCENSKERFSDASSLLDWGFANYECFTPVINDDDLKDIKIILGEKEYMSPQIEDIHPILLPRGHSGNIEKQVEAASDLKAPVEQGQKVGTVKFISDSQVLSEYNLYAGEYIGKIRFLDYIAKIFVSVN